MNYVNKNTYFRNIHLFFIKAKKMIIIKNSQMMRDNL